MDTWGMTKEEREATNAATKKMFDRIMNAEEDLVKLLKHIIDCHQKGYGLDAAIKDAKEYLDETQ